MNSPSIATADCIIQVHGTFASRKEDRGEAWWQVGSSAYEGIRKRLPNGISMTELDEVFHWSGENSERARIKAAVELLAKLKKLESDGRGYHLVGHSHGGSVIWHALRIATLNRIGLDHLRSWATVGTPFMRHKMHCSSRFTNVLRVLLGLVLIKPAIATADKLFDLVFRPHASVWLGGSANLPERFTFYETPVLRLLELMHQPIERTATGIRIGSFDSSMDHSSVNFLFTTTLGWVILGLAVVVMLVYINLSAFFLRPVIESLQLWAENRLERKARNVFSSRWLGLWSPDDEAINGLRATLDLTVSFVSKMAPQERVLFSDYATLTMRPYYWVMTPVFNSLLRPFLDKMVRSLVVKTAQGNNRPGSEVVEVCPVPWNTENALNPIALPTWLNDRLVSTANESAREIVPKLRAILAAPSFVSGLETLGKSNVGKELVHTSYFDHDEVLDLLAMHVVGSCDIVQWQESSLSPQRQELAQWLAEAKSRVGSRLFASTLALHSSTAKPAPRIAADTIATETIAAELPLRIANRPRRRTASERAA